MHSSIEGFDIKRVGLYIQSKLTPLCGDWQWDMASAAVYCSDVMLTFPLHLEGTKGIIHPDDLPIVIEVINKLEYLKQANLQFRIITTYGEVKTLTGEHIYLANPEPGETLQPEEELLNLVQKQKDLEAELATLREKQLAFEEAGKLAGTGMWYYNKDKQEAYYSDQVFLFHGLPPQSLNAHINTFTSFIHQQDREIVLDAIEKSFMQELPLHLEYRIVTVNGAERHVRNIIQWMYTPSGERLLQGTIQDYTAFKEAETYRDQTAQQLWLQKQRLQFTESNTSTGFWQQNIITRKFTASDNFIRLHGLKPHATTGGLSTFLNFVHPDDRAVVDNYYKTLQREQTANDIEYRIIRADGKQRFLQQQGKTIIDDSGNITLIGLIQDITVIKSLEEKLKERTESYQLNQHGLSIGESMVQTGTWWWNQESDEQFWSDGVYQLLGYKPQSMVLTQRHLLKLIHPEYRKAFSDAVTLTLREEQETNFEIKLSRNGELRQLKAAFKLFHYEEKRIFIGVFQDITKEQQLQSELASRMELADLLTENLPDRVLLTDSENNILFWNKQCEKYYKLKRDHVLGKNFFDVFPQLQTAEKIHQFNTVLNGEAVHHQGTQSIIYKDIADLHMLPLHAEDKKIMGILHILHDVSEETTLRKNLTERLQFIQNLVEASVDRIVALDQNMNYTYWNKRAEEYYDLKKEKVLGKNILEVFPAFVNDPSFAEFRKALRGETIYIPANATDNYGQYFATYLIPIKGDGNEVTSILWITHDLSKEVLLTKQQEKSNDILNMVNAIFIEIDFDYRFKYINKKAEDYLNSKPEELLGQVMWEVIPQAVGTEGHRAIQTACEQRQEVETEYFSTVFNKWMFLSAIPSPDGVLIFMYDRQDIKEIQQKLIESEALLRRSEQVVAIGSYEADLTSANVRFSDGMFRLFGEEPQSFEPSVEFIDVRSHPDDTAVVKQILEQAAATKQPYYYTRRIYRADGEERFIETHGHVITDEAGNAIKFIGLVQDITERKKAESEIQRSKHFLQQVTDTAPDAITVFDLSQNKATYINPPVIESLLGYNVAELEAMGFEGRLRNIIHADHQDAILAFNEKLRNDGLDTILTLEYQVKTKKGYIKWLANRGKAFIANEPGNPKMILSVLQDITRQKEAALELQESKQFIEEIMNATLDFIMVFDFTVNHITYVNRQAYKEDEDRYQETLRISYEQILGRAHPDDREGLHQFIQGFKNLPDQEVRSFDFRELRGDKMLWFRSRGKVFKRDANGQVLQYISVVQDISHERILYDQLAERTAFAEAVVEASVDAIIVLDKDLCIKTWNRRCEELYGISKEKAINQRFTDIFPQVANDTTLVNSFERSIQGEFMYLPAKLSAYTNRICEYFFVPLKNEQNEVYGVLNIIHDISRQEEYSNALQEMNLLLQQQNVELEQRNEEISTFAFVASHDLKEPLRKIHTFSDWLLERESEQLSTKGQDFLKRLNASVHRLNMLIDDILVLTKIHTDTRNDEDVNLNEVLKAVEEDLEELIVRTNTSIISEPLPTITSNRNQLFYLFRNLMHNAIKFQRPGNKPFIEISADVERNVNHPYAQSKREYLKLAIHDNGIGFDQKYARKMFKIFQQLHQRGEYDGTGMGLAICRKIMENNKGFITAESEEGEGSVFYCYFPLY